MYSTERITTDDIVFLGDSLTESFDLRKHFGKSNIKNRGISGNMTEHVLYRLEEITNAKPAKLFLMIGINDIYQGIAIENIFGNIARILTEMLEESPATKLYCLSILPVNEGRLLSFENINEKIYRINNMLREFCIGKDILFVDIHPDFLNQQGQMDEKYTFDGVHLTPQGYIHWSDLISDLVC